MRVPENVNTVLTQQSHSADQIKVLLVADMVIIRLGLMALLENDSSIQLVGSVNLASEALAFCKQSMPDVVLIDLDLPDGSGLDLIETLLAQNRLLKFGVITSHTDRTDVLLAMSSGANAYCVKDSCSQNIAQIIHHIFQGGMWVDPAVASYVQDVLCQVQCVPTKPSGVEVTYHFTAREQEILRLIVQGRSNPEIAQFLSISVHTVKVLVTQIIRKFEVEDRLQAAVKAIRLNLA